MTTQLKATALIDNKNNKTFYGLDLGAAARAIIGIELKLKLGVKY
jgi:hypothetical protein